jgi:hypothetical protein
MWSNERSVLKSCSEKVKFNPVSPSNFILDDLVEIEMPMRIARRRDIE